MRILSLPRISFIAVLFFSLISCSEKESFQTEPLTDYLPVTPGKYITYRLDSTVFTNFGRNTEVHSYQEKHVIDALIDTMGHQSYRVFRYLRDSAGLQSWQPMPGGTYYITLYNDQIEVIENNLRFIKLHAPLRDGYNWRGNRYIPTDPYGSLYTFSNDDNMEDWDYFYDGSPTSFSYRNKNYDDVYTVEETDENYNVPIVDPAAYAARSRAVERYSKTIGLVYREYEMWEYQPNPGGPSPYKIGFGIKEWMIDHN